MVIDKGRLPLSISAVCEEVAKIEGDASLETEEVA